MAIGRRPVVAAARSSTGRACSRVDVLLLIDQSASLRKTDPQDQRVAAAEVLLRSLAATAAASGTSVDVTVAAFGTDTVEVGRASLPSGVDGAVDVVRPFAEPRRPTSTPTTCWPCRSPSATSRRSPTCRRTASAWCGSPTGPTASTTSTPRASPAYTSTTDRATVVASSRGRSVAACRGRADCRRRSASRSAGRLRGAARRPAQRRHRERGRAARPGGDHAGDRPAPQRGRQRRLYRARRAGRGRPGRPTWPPSSSSRARSPSDVPRSTAPPWPLVIRPPRCGR